MRGAWHGASEHPGASLRPAEETAAWGQIHASERVGGGDEETRREEVR